MKKKIGWRLSLKVEYEDGTMHKVDPECIVFTDRD